MLRMLRAGSRPGRPAPVVRVLAVLVAVGLLVSVAPFLGGMLAWVLGVL